MQVVFDLVYSIQKSSSVCEGHLFSKIENKKKGNKKVKIKTGKGDEKGKWKGKGKKQKEKNLLIIS